MCCNRVGRCATITTTTLDLANYPRPVPSGIPSLLPPGFPGLLPTGTPWLLSLGNPGDIAKSWSSLQNVPGCAWEIYTSISTSKFVVGPACCKVFQK
ncbi:hypothetical protein L3X38_001574 [Prunus dulcis]|uniref:Prolamin-like domain-containing protein n=1 Tax=Prunus dulcis TaxID=3755 RepID=A0AAD4WUB9_PRUDU|nr:hypothetical protein L3X38_001574 [Prunus dulcis]